MNLPKHIELSIIHNPHRGDYETVERWLELNEVRDGADILPEDRAEILRTGEIWVVRWYPETPVGWCAVAAASLERAVKLAADESESESDRMHRAADAEFSEVAARHEEFRVAVAEAAIAHAAALDAGPPIAVNLYRSIAAAIPVLEAARALAANEFLGPDPGGFVVAVVDLKEQVRAAVCAFGGGGPYGIKRASGHLAEMRELAAVAKQLCDALTEALQGWEDNTRWDTQYPSWEHDPACARISELRKLLGEP